MSILDEIVNAFKQVPAAAEKAPSQLGNLLNPSAAGQKVASGANAALSGVENPITNALDVTTNPSSTEQQVGSALSGLGGVPQQSPGPSPVAATPPVAHVGGNQPEPLSFQGMLTKYFEPLIKSVGAGLGPSQVNQALSGYQGIPSVGANIASTLHTSIQDWQGGLQSMLNSLPQEAPQQAILAGMKSLLSYPVTSLSGVNGAPPGVQSSDALMQLYSALNLERNGQAPATTSANDQLGGYTNNVTSIIPNG